GGGDPWPEGRRDQDLRRRSARGLANVAKDCHLEKLAKDLHQEKGQGGRPQMRQALSYRGGQVLFCKDAEICVNAIEEFVQIFQKKNSCMRASLGKRKTTPKPPPMADSKKHKIW
ncbi:unnamed protein product, partial [Urochloa humidicola]